MRPMAPSSSNRAIDVAAALAKTEGARLTIVTVVTPVTENIQREFQRIEGDRSDPAEAAGQVILADAQQRAGWADIKGKSILLCGRSGRSPHRCDHERKGRCHRPRSSWPWTARRPAAGQRIAKACQPLALHGRCRALRRSLKGEPFSQSTGRIPDHGANSRASQSRPDKAFAILTKAASST